MQRVTSTSFPWSRSSEVAITVATWGGSLTWALPGSQMLTAGARGGSKAHRPLAGKQYASTFCRLLSAFVVGPELERAQAVLYRIAPSARALRRNPGVSLGLGRGRSPL
jgi:hypothetical protein